jgi:hypothetical protein
MWNTFSFLRDRYYRQAEPLSTLSMSSDDGSAIDLHFKVYSAPLFIPAAHDSYLLTARHVFAFAFPLVIPIDASR